MLRVLIVEDSASMRAFVRTALTTAPQLGELEIAEAKNGFDALRLLPRGAWDLVITDINMPDINGLELLSFIRKSEAHKATPVLIISTASAPRDRERGVQLGANAYLVKPFSAEALVEQVGPLLRGELTGRAHA
ncbi:MAG TPA: response regulator [Polyangiaceae bacterium]|nr:response regulator [Polyangiaceae bacterium]